VCTAGRAPRGGESPSRKRPRACHSGQEVGDPMLGSGAGRRRCRVRRVGAGQDLRVPTGKLKNWKSEKLTSRPAKLARQDFRISGFHPSTCRPKICRLGPVGGWGGESPECSPNLPFPGYQGTSGMYCKQSFPCRALVGSLRPKTEVQFFILNDANTSESGHSACNYNRVGLLVRLT
jgi:hypothetical protein